MAPNAVEYKPKKQLQISNLSITSDKPWNNGTQRCSWRESSPDFCKVILSLPDKHGAYEKG